jgi:hypothetical protein
MLFKNLALRQENLKRSSATNINVLIYFSNPTPAPSTIVWPRLGANREFMSLGPVATPSTGYHPEAATFWACTVPAIEGHKPAWCP